MRILKRIIFLSILGSIFIVLYRNSDKKGFRRWWISFKMAVFIAGILAGLIPNSTEEIEPYVPNNSPSMERVLSNQEFNSLDENDRQVILAKADGNPATPPNRGAGPNNFPVAPPSGGRPSRPISGVNPSRIPPKVVDQGLDAGANPAGAGGGGGAAEFEEYDTCPAPQKQKPDQINFENSRSYQDKKKKKKQSRVDELAKPDLPLDVRQKLTEDPKLLELSIDPRTGQIDKQSFDEAESISQAQRETELFNDARRPDLEKGERDIDYILSGPLYDEADIKTPKSFFDTRKGSKKPIPQDMLDYLAKQSGGKSILQKNGSDRCLHILDLKDLLPHQRERYKAKYLEGAREKDPVLAEHIRVLNN